MDHKILAEVDLPQIAGMSEGEIAYVPAAVR
jgi:hypothetical protein